MNKYVANNRPDITFMNKVIDTTYLINTVVSEMHDLYKTVTSTKISQLKKDTAAESSTYCSTYIIHGNSAPLSTTLHKPNPHLHMCIQLQTSVVPSQYICNSLKILNYQCITTHYVVLDQYFTP